MNIDLYISHTVTILTIYGNDYGSHMSTKLYILRKYQPKLWNLERIATDNILITWSKDLKENCPGGSLLWFNEVKNK